MKNTELSGFQYISCYCLSETTTEHRTLLSHFNTSHVTVYRFIHVHKSIFIQFQYISCYCLSHRTETHQFVTCISIHLMLLFIDNDRGWSNTVCIFQYISCYCLSSSKTICLGNTLISIHLMLLFITERSNFVSLLKHFNTSHVTVYPQPLELSYSFLLFQYISCYCLSTYLCFCFYQILISIHLMLLFIGTDGDNANAEYKFQYISCYCLSCLDC